MIWILAAVALYLALMVAGQVAARLFDEEDGPTLRGVFYGDIRQAFEFVCFVFRRFR